MEKEIKKLLDLGIRMELNGYYLSKTDFRTKSGAKEYCLLHPDGNSYYYYDDGEDKSFKDAIKIFKQD